MWRWISRVPKEGDGVYVPLLRTLCQRLLDLRSLHMGQRRRVSVVQYSQALTGLRRTVLHQFSQIMSMFQIDFRVQ